MKSVLSAVRSGPTRGLAFVVNAYGCPAVAFPELSFLRFNLSNTRGLIACAVARDREIGVDVESRLRAGMTVEIAHRFFRPPRVPRFVVCRRRPSEGASSRTGR